MHLVCPGIWQLPTFAFVQLQLEISIRFMSLCLRFSALKRDRSWQDKHVAEWSHLQMHDKWLELPATSMPERREKGPENHGSNASSSWIGKLLCKCLLSSVFPLLPAHHFSYHVCGRVNHLGLTPRNFTQTFKVCFYHHGHAKLELTWTLKTFSVNDASESAFAALPSHGFFCPTLPGQSIRCSGHP